MELDEESPSKPSVAELAGRFKGHILLTMPAVQDEVKSVPSSPIKIRTKSSSIIERLQANLALSPSTLLPSPKGGESERRADSPPPAVVTTPPGHAPGPSVREEEEREDPVGFDGAPEGAPLPSFHKTRVRLSFKRRPPTRRHRRSAGDSPSASLDGHAASWPQADGDAVSKMDVGEDEVNEEGEEDCEEVRSETTATSTVEVKDEETRQTDGREADAPC